MRRSRKARRTGEGDPFGFGFAWDQWDTTTHGAGLSVMANEYDALAGRPVFAGLAQRWLDDILGANAWGVSLVVGDGTVYPDCMQHQIANLVGSLDGRPPILAGAAVEGPNSFAATGTVPDMRPRAANGPGNVPYSIFNGHRAVFAGNVQSYSTVEPAIDLTAATPLAFAWQERADRAVGRPVQPGPALTRALVRQLVSRQPARPCCVKATRQADRCRSWPSQPGQSLLSKRDVS